MIRYHLELHPEQEIISLSLPDWQTADGVTDSHMAGGGLLAQLGSGQLSIYNLGLQSAENNFDKPDRSCLTLCVAVRII